MSHYQTACYESQRLSQLKEYNILDTLTEKDYEEVTFLASVICVAPIALISFVDKDRQWFKSHQGLTGTETSREYSFCAHAINQPGKLMVVPDARADDRFKNNPLVTGEPNIVFYAGFPLVNENGFGLGTVCVIDKQQRTLSENQMRAIEALSVQVMNLLELRKKKNELEKLRQQLEEKNKQLEQFAMVVAHDIKSPLSTVLSANQMLNDIYKEEDNDAVQLIAASHMSAKKIKSLVDGILSYYKGDGQSDGYENICLNQFFDTFKQTIQLTKPWTVTYNLQNQYLFYNRTKLEQIFFNLISNSIRYNSEAVAEIKIESKETNDHYCFTVSDNGIGIRKENHDTIFNLYATVSPTDTGGYKSFGIGLPTIKKLIENTGGSIRVDSEWGKGTTFSFSLKKVGRE